MARIMFVLLLNCDMKSDQKTEKKITKGFEAVKILYASSAVYIRIYIISGRSKIKPDSSKPL